MHILLAIAQTGKCKLCNTGRLIHPAPTLLTHPVNINTGEIYESFVYESWCDDDNCGAYHLTFGNEKGAAEQVADKGESWKNLLARVDKRLRVGIVKVKQSGGRQSGKPLPFTHNTYQEVSEMPEIIQDFDAKIQRSGSGSGRPQIFHIDLTPLDQVAGKTQKDNKTPVFVKYTVEDLDGASDATFQQQVRNYADNMDKGNTNHGYRAKVLTRDRMDENDQPVKNEDGEQVSDFFVAVIPVTEADIKRRESYQRARANGRKSEGGSETGKTQDSGKSAGPKDKNATTKAKNPAAAK